MAFLTVFSAPKPFTNPHINTIQRNAIQSWQHLGPEVEVFLVGQEDGMAEAATEYGVPLLAEVKRNEAGTPLVSSIFDLARRASSSPYLAYVNGDILLLPDIVQATRQISAGMRGSKGSEADALAPFLLIGQRWDLKVEQPIGFLDRLGRAPARDGTGAGAIARSGRQRLLRIPAPGVQRDAGFRHRPRRLG